MPESPTIRSRLAEVRARIARAASRADRDPGSVRLVAVSKTFPVDAIREAVDAGQIDFGENRVQEALQKMDQTAGLPIRWHLVGHLQSNKAKKAGSHFDVVQSVDSPDLMPLLDDGARIAGRQVQALVQVDLAGEVTKFGAREGELPEIFAEAARGKAARIAGLMTIPPAAADPEEARPYFRALREVRDRLVAGGVDPSILADLSMGMSHDFEIAIEEGATIVRVGSAIFGAR